MFQCQECGKKFKTTAAAERASSNGCPKCGGCDIDLAPLSDAVKTPTAYVARIKALFPGEAGYVERGI
jgi:predicted  nucleic acid-binding Zn-ribbon protein